ncbi:MAG: hypothetical protein K0R65_2976 [Crocinitomicaceae bacterium]|nr:hypothetical protein [Crocinitomicaceae bacterium]
MKKTLLFSLFTCLCSLGFFAQKTSNLVVFSDDASLFYVIVNGIKQNIEPQSNVKITGLTNDANQVTIIFSNEKYGSLKKSIYFPEMGYEATARLTKTKKGYKMRYFGETPIDGSSSNPNQWTTTYHTTEPATTIEPIVDTWNTTGTTTTTTNSNPTGTESTTQTTGTASTTTNTQTTGSWETNNTTTTTTVVNPAAVDMSYTWTPGMVYQFSAVQTDDVSTSMMGMSMKDQFKTVTDFALYITNVMPGGEASGILYLLNFNVTDSRNAVLASINDIPKSAIQSDVKVDRKGKFTFMKKIMLITTEKGNVLAYGNVDENSVSMSGQAGNMQVDAYAEFDPKTGKLKTGYNVKEIKNTRKVTVQLNENTDMVDVLPYDFLELLALPEGGVASGDKSTMRAGMYSVDMTVNSMANGIAGLNYKMSTDKSKDMFTGDAKTTDGNGNTMFDMNTEGFGNMEEMELTQEDKAAMDMSKMMSPDMSCDINSTFNYATGMFDQVYGTVNTSMDAMGMKMEVKSFLQMRKL